VADRSIHQKQRDDLTGEHAFTDIGQLVLAILFFAVWIVDVFVLRWTAVSGETVPLAARASVAGLVFVSAVYLGYDSCRILFAEHRAEPHVVRNGVFAVVRHPMYLAEILFYLGILLLACSIAATAVWLLVIAFLHVVARREETLLLDRFGDAYAQYMAEVPMWIPDVRRRGGVPGVRRRRK